MYKKFIVELQNRFAELCHARWKKIQQDLHSKCIKNDDGSMTLSKDDVEHWETLIDAPYTNLHLMQKEDIKYEIREILIVIFSMCDKFMEEAERHIRGMPYKREQND